MARSISTADGELCRLCVPVLFVLLLAIYPMGRSALAQSAEGGIAGSSDSDTPDIPIPTDAHGTYSPIVEGFASPLEPRENLRAIKAPKPPVEEPAADADEKVWLKCMRQRLDDDVLFSETAKRRRIAVPIGCRAKASMVRAPRL